MFYLDSLYKQIDTIPCAYCDEQCDPEDLIWNESTIWGGACPDCLATCFEDID